MRIPPQDDPRFQPKFYRSQRALAIVAPTWEVSEKFDFEPDFIEAYRRNPNVALRDFGSVPSYSVESFLRDPDLVEQRANHDRQHPIREDGTFEDWFLPKGRFHYYYHMDMSARRDATGIAMGHWERDRVSYLPDIGEVKGMVVIDLMHQILAEPGKEIDYEKLRQLLYAIRRRGFYIRKVTMDQFQSVDMSQTLTKKGFDVELFSVDRATLPYDTVLELMYFGQIDYYPHPIFMSEFRKLEIKDGRKIDHPPKGSKDVSDAVAAVTAQARDSTNSEPAGVSSSVSRQRAALSETPTEQRKREKLIGFKDTTSIIL